MNVWPVANVLITRTRGTERSNEHSPLPPLTTPAEGSVCTLVQRLVCNRAGDIGFQVFSGVDGNRQ
jgi:hypothetical protein